MSADTPHGTRLVFPDGFTWGAATSAHQIEGGNVNNDWWVWEHDPHSGITTTSGDACDSYTRWREDIDLVGQLGLSAYRFSLEWSRIEPAEGEFSHAALEHYRRVCAACLGQDISPFVTLHHFTTPRWLAQRGGWEAPDAAACFARYASRVAAYLGDLIGWAGTINEANALARRAYLDGLYPPGVEEDLLRYEAVTEALLRAHRLATEALRSGPGAYPTGLIISMGNEAGDEGRQTRREMAATGTEESFLQACSEDDFVGVACGSGGSAGPALEDALHRAAALSGRPVVVTGHGLATYDDTERIAFLGHALEAAHRCVQDGIDLRGFFVWSLLDGFEWRSGFRPRFGLVAVAPGIFERRPKPSAHWFGHVAQTNALVLARL